VIFPRTFTGAIWASLVLSILFVALYVSWLAQRARDMSQALTASQLALVREQRMSALGGLAAAAAHELGSPLSTIAVVSKELLHDLPPGSALAEDAALLVQETKRCRDILVELEQRNAGPPDSDDPYHHLPVSTLLEVAAHTRTSRTMSPSPFSLIPSTRTRTSAHQQIWMKWTCPCLTNPPSHAGLS